MTAPRPARQQQKRSRRGVDLRPPSRRMRRPRVIGGFGRGSSASLQSSFGLVIMRTKAQRRIRRAKEPPREPSLLSASQMGGLVVFAALMCVALWVAFSPPPDPIISESPQLTALASRPDVPLEGTAPTGQLSDITPSASFTPSSVIRFKRCGRIRTNCVVDGDTFWYQGVKIRVADVDAPEIGKPRCARELQLGMLATDYLVQFLNEGRFDLRQTAGRHQDRYGRELYVLHRGERSFGDELLERGLGHRWIGRKQSWCG